MMGRREDGQGQFFYAFDLDKVVPPDHLVRQIDAVLDLSWVHKELAPCYSHTGRPSIDPVLMIRMLIVGYVFAIRSERRICAEVEVNLAYRWFCKLGIEDTIPDHSVFCRARHERFRESDALRRVFEGVVAMCIAAGLVGGEAFSIDASLIKADVDKKKRAAGDQPIAWPKAEEASRAVREYLTVLDAARGDEESGDGDGDGSSGGGSRRVTSTSTQAVTVLPTCWLRPFARRTASGTDSSVSVSRMRRVLVQGSVIASWPKMSCMIPKSASSPVKPAPRSATAAVTAARSRPGAKSFMRSAKRAAITRSSGEAGTVIGGGTPASAPPPSASR